MILFLLDCPIKLLWFSSDEINGSRNQENEEEVLVVVAVTGEPLFKFYKLKTTKEHPLLPSFSTFLVLHNMLLLEAPGKGLWLLKLLLSEYYIQ